MKLYFKDLGLAAFVFMSCKTKVIIDESELKKGVIILETEDDKSYNEWKVEYMPTDCRKHDLTIMEFRALVRSARSGS